jgi:hypothetical protein
VLPLLLAAGLVNDGPACTTNILAHSSESARSASLLSAAWSNRAACVGALKHALGFCSAAAALAQSVPPSCVIPDPVTRTTRREGGASQARPQGPKAKVSSELGLSRSKIRSSYSRYTSPADGVRLRGLADSTRVVGACDMPIGNPLNDDEEESLSKTHKDLSTSPTLLK